MLTMDDYRAALLQAYRAARNSRTKGEAYAYARAIVVPLPETKRDVLIRDSRERFERYRAVYRSNWALPYCSARETWRNVYGVGRELSY